jgi:hypothetical protein
MDKQNKQRLEQLVRQGLVPSRKLPMLMKAMSSLHMGKQLSPTERDVLAKYMHNMTDIMLKDDTVFNRAKLHTQKTKYQTEESTVDLEEKMKDGIEIVDGPEEEIKNKKKAKDEVKENMDPEEEERIRKKQENKARRLSVKSRSKFRMLPKELRKQKEKAGLDEDISKMNEDYKSMFEAGLECYGIDNIRDLPEEKKAEFFKLVDAALEEAKMANKDHDGDGKVETSTAEYMGSRDKAIKKATKPSWDSKQARANALDSLDKKAQARQDMKKEEVELTFEEMTPQQKADRMKMIARAQNRVDSGDAARDAEKRAAKAAKADYKVPGAKRGLAPTKKDVEEQVLVLRKTINEGTTREKVEAYKELNQIIEQFKTTGEL